MKRWPTKPLGELVDFIGGGTPRRDRPGYWGGEIPWASVKDLQSQSLETTLENITAEGLANSASNLIPEGTVIIASRVGLGKAAINRKPVAINQDLKALTPRGSDLSPQYLLLFLISKAEYFERAGVGATVKGLTIADYQRLNIVLLPLAEQDRIAKLLDESDELRKLRAQADRRTAALVPALFHEMFGDPVSNLKGWPLTTIGALGGVGQYGLNAAAMVDRIGVRFIRITDIDEAGKLGRCEPAYVPFDTPDLDHYELSVGDVLIARSGATAGKSCLHEGLPERAVFAGYLIRFKFDQKEVLPIFIASFLQTPAYWQQLNSHKRAVAQPNVNAKQLASIRLPLPPLPLQKEFAARVSEIRAMQAEQAASRRRLENLFQSMLHRAFQGEL